MSTPEIDLENHLRELDREAERQYELERRLFPSDKAWKAIYESTTLEEYLEARAELDEVLDHAQEMFEPEPI